MATREELARKILARAGDVPPGYWDDAEVRGASSKDEAERLKAEIRASQLPPDYWQGAETREDAPVDTDGAPFGYWDDTPGLTQEEAAKIRQEQLDKTPGLAAKLFGEDAEKPARFEGESDEEYAERTAPLEKGRLFEASGPSPRDPDQTAPGEKPQVIAMGGPQFQGSSHEAGPIFEKVAAVATDPLSRTLDAVPVLGPAVKGARMVSAGLTANADRLDAKDPGRPARFGADMPPPRAQVDAPASSAAKPTGAPGGGALLQSEKNLRAAANANAATLGGLQGESRDVAKLQIDAENTLAQEAIAKNEAAASIRADAQRRAAEERAKRVEAEQRQKKMLEEDQASLKTMRDELGAMKVEDRRSFGARLGGAIAMALGAYGSALTGQKNTAADIVMQSIQDDLNMQREAIANKRSAYGEAKNLYKENLERFKDERAAMLATEMGLLDEAERKIDAMIKGNTNQEILARADQAKAAIAEKRIANEQEFAGASLNRAVQVEGKIADIAGKRAELSQKAAAAKADAEGRIPGLVGTGTSKQAANEAADMWGSGKAILDQMADLRRHVFGDGVNDGFGREVLPTDAAKRAQNMAETLRLELGKNLLKLGVLSADDMDALNRIIPRDPTQMNQGAVKSQLDEAEKYVKRKMTAYLFARGYAPADARADLGEGTPVQ
jgi:hypothetical protein